MTEALYMDEIDGILKNVFAVAVRPGVTSEALEATKDAAIAILVRRYHLDPDEAQSHVAAAAGEEP